MPSGDQGSGARLHGSGSGASRSDHASDDGAGVLGRLAYESTLWRDFPVLQLTVMVWTTLVIAVNFLVDLSYGLVDPRIRR